MGGRKMENPNVSYIYKLSEKEEKTVFRVLENYNFDVINIAKVRNVYRVETSCGNVCLKRIKHGRHKIINGNILAEGFINEGFGNIAKYYKTKNNETYVRYKGSVFYITEWIDGEECNLDSIEEAKNCVKLLAQYHMTCNNIEMKKLKIKNKLRDWPRIFKENLHDLEKFERIINRKKLKCEFDMVYLNYIESVYNRGIIALRLLNTSNFYKLCKQARKDKTVCHAGFYHEDIIKRGQGYYIIDLDNIIVDLRVNDLGKFIRQLMFKKTHKWDFQKAKLIIEEYCSIVQLNRNELETMLALIIFPHKFCKLGKKRYIKHKVWEETKYTYKLNRLVRYNTNQDRFLDDYLAYINNKQ
ncbi:CotS family spore coat protein [Clostridiaceae bacterium UIB06]|uniref:CotS family spore coat protein n=2 Tax=Clostridium thailandense TaxID=2794346 RepID=A0A949TWE0_9CLOT|nr:CotS family spore coat protein [Clostridium thailandense]MCH5137580.1 CotS family spore coat protein [Clostridiaceae bacterium UIB06]